MSELADAIGVKRPTLYFYFPDVGAVFESVLEQTYQTHAEIALARMRAEPTPVDRLLALVDVTVAFHRERPQLIGGCSSSGRWVDGTWRPCSSAGAAR